MLTTRSSSLPSGYRIPQGLIHFNSENARVALQRTAKASLLSKKVRDRKVEFGFAV